MNDRRFPAQCLAESAARLARGVSSDGRGRPAGGAQAVHGPAEPSSCPKRSGAGLPSTAALGGHLNGRQPTRGDPSAYSHSIIFGYRNPLNSKRKFFLLTAKLRRPIRQKFQLLFLKENFGDSKFARFHSLSASIGRFSRSSVRTAPSDSTQKIPSAQRPQSMRLRSPLL